MCHCLQHRLRVHLTNLHTVVVKVKYQLSYWQTIQAIHSFTMPRSTHTQTQNNT